MGTYDTTYKKECATTYETVCKGGYGGYHKREAEASSEPGYGHSRYGYGRNGYGSRKGGVFGKSYSYGSRYGAKAHSYKKCQKVPVKVPRQVCHKVPVPVCKDVPRQDCHSVPRQECRAVPFSVPRQECITVPRQVCNPVAREECVAISEQLCNNVPRQACTTVPEQVCRAVPRQVCQERCVETTQQLVDVQVTEHVDHIVEAPVQSAHLEIAAPVATPAVTALPLGPAPAVAHFNAQPIAPLAGGNLVAHPNGAVVPANTAAVAAAISDHLRHFVAK